MFCLVNFMSFVNITSFPVIQTCNHIPKKVGTVKHLPLCNVAISLFTTLKKTFRDWRHQVIKCFRCNFVPFFLQTSLKVGNSTGSSLSHFALQNAPHILYWRQVGTAGRPVKYPYPLPPQPGLCNVCRMWFCIVLLKYAWTSLEKMSSWRQHIVLQNLYVLSAVMVPSQKCKLPLPRALTQPHTMTDPGFWTCCW